ncbi:MAG: YigZ family protein [Methylotenera sp.]|nr:YigZ family protein [Methylotenera sp.]
MITITQSGFAEQTINKSRFLAWAAQCEDERAVGAMLRAIASKHATASHLAYAFRVKTPDGVVPRFSDAGEPSGTAGKPILQMLDGRHLINVCVGVIRYYGGVNLGTGGLVKAYGGTAKMALEAAVLAPFVEMQRIEINIDYKRVDELMRVVEKAQGTVLDKQFGEQVKVQIVLPTHAVEAVANRFTQPY